MRNQTNKKDDHSIKVYPVDSHFPLIALRACKIESARVSATACVPRRESFSLMVSLTLLAFDPKPVAPFQTGESASLSRTISCTAVWLLYVCTYTRRETSSHVNSRSVSNFLLHATVRSKERFWG